eukprot:GHVT01009542.1.p1 GENE.GHVT01009542.1~~GHVT01009542.1.p1  ORF type:complete len:659 (+),score=16.48 GHVT01009542.1:229-1977(+)
MDSILGQPSVKKVARGDSHQVSLPKWAQKNEEALPKKEKRKKRKAPKNTVQRRVRPTPIQAGVTVLATTMVMFALGAMAGYFFLSSSKELIKTLDSNTLKALSSASESFKSDDIPCEIESASYSYDFRPCPTLAKKDSYVAKETSSIVPKWLRDIEFNPLTSQWTPEQNAKVTTQVIEYLDDPASLESNIVLPHPTFVPPFMREHIRAIRSAYLAERKTMDRAKLQSESKDQAVMRIVTFLKSADYMNKSVKRLILSLPAWPKRESLIQTANNIQRHTGVLLYKLRDMTALFSIQEDTPNARSLIVDQLNEAYRQQVQNLRDLYESTTNSNLVTITPSRTRAAELDLIFSFVAALRSTYPSLDTVPHEQLLKFLHFPPIGGQAGAVQAAYLRTLWASENVDSAIELLKTKSVEFERSAGKPSTPIWFLMTSIRLGLDYNIKNIDFEKLVLVPHFSTVKGAFWTPLTQAERVPELPANRSKALIPIFTVFKLAITLRDYDKKLKNVDGLKHAARIITQIYDQGAPACDSRPKVTKETPFLMCYSDNAYYWYKGKKLHLIEFWDIPKVDAFLERGEQDIIEAEG